MAREKRDAEGPAKFTGYLPGGIVEPVQSDRVVFLLGAGASAQYGLPVMANFMNIARRRLFDVYGNASKYETEARRLSTLLNFHAECLASSWAVNRSWDNIEELYTQADLCRIAKIPDAKVASEICKSIAWAIWDIYRTDKNWESNRLAAACAGIYQAGLQPAVVTTNYDLVAERSIGHHPAIELMQGFYYPGFEIPGVEVGAHKPMHWEGYRKSVEYGLRRVPVIKLHGSVNWFEFENGDNIAFYDQGLQKGAAIDTTSKFESEQLDFEQFAARVGKLCEGEEYEPGVPESPMIVPPMLGKSSDIEVIAYQWRQAIQVLSRARAIIIVGYSFPTTDAFMSRLISQGIRSNGDLESIVVVNLEDEESFYGKLRAMFNATFLNTKIRYVQAPARTFINVLSNTDAKSGAEWTGALKQICENGL